MFSKAFFKKHVYDIAAYAGLAATFILFLIFSGENLSYNVGTVGILEVPTSSAFSQTVREWTISHNATDGFVTFSLDGSQYVTPGGSIFAINGTIASVFNRNSDIRISGNMEPFATGDTEINHTVTALRIQPRTWTL